MSISEGQLGYIYGPDYDFFLKEILHNCYCGSCVDRTHDATIVDYTIFLNGLGDIVLRGSCARCGGGIGRYLETGEVPDYRERIARVRNGLDS